MIGTPAFNTIPVTICSIGVSFLNMCTVLLHHRIWIMKFLSKTSCVIVSGIQSSLYESISLIPNLLLTMYKSFICSHQWRFSPHGGKWGNANTWTRPRGRVDSCPQKWRQWRICSYILYRMSLFWRGSSLAWNERRMGSVLIPQIFHSSGW